jgi:DNA-binding MarR family transcriptional regulator
VTAEAIVPLPERYLRAGWTIARLARHLEVALGELDLSPAQYRLLVQLAQGADASTSLAKKLAVSPPSVTMVVDGLVQRQAVERTPSVEDRRRISLALTDLGRDLIARAEAAVQARLEAIASTLAAPDAAAALAALDLWGAALEEYRLQRLAREKGAAAPGSR